MSHAEPVRTSGSQPFELARAQSVQQEEPQRASNPQLCRWQPFWVPVSDLAFVTFFLDQARLKLAVAATS